MHLVDVLLRLIHRQLRFVPFFLGKIDCGLAGCGVRLDVLFKLRQNPRCLFQGELVFLGIDRAHQFIFLDIQFRPPHVVTGFEQRHLVLRGQNRGISLCLGDFLLRLQ